MMKRYGSDAGGFLGEADGIVAFVLFRVLLGFDMLMHGVARFVTDGLPKFVGMTVHEFAATILPAWMVGAFATAIPFVELTIGALLTVGLATRWALVLGVALMGALIFGNALLGKWEIVTQELVYGAGFCALLATAKWNRFALDARRR
jgi:thiosulfate dehydrogenase (quinone) large subunit